jgi:hypothetical protein
LSFDGRLAQIRAMQACNPERRAWSSVEEFDRGKEPELGDAPLADSEHKRAPSLRADFSRGERAGGVGPSGFR